jgi:hypothetical protein
MSNLVAPLPAFTSPHCAAIPPSTATVSIAASTPSMSAPVPTSLRHRRVPLVVSMVFAAIGLAACGGSGSTDAPPPQPPSTAAGSGKLQPASEAGALVTQAQALIRARRSLVESAFAVTVTGVPAGGAPAPAPTATPTATPTTNGADAFSETTRQEEGVDEDDLVKTDGSVLYSFGGDVRAAPTLQAHRRNADGALTALGDMALSVQGLANGLPQQQVIGLMLSTTAKRVAALRALYSFAGSVCQPDVPCAMLALPAPMANDFALDLVPTLADGRLGSSVKVQVQGRVVASRMVGTTLYVVSEHAPRLEGESLPTATQREEALSSLTAAQLLPTYRVDGGEPRALVDETQCYTQPGNSSTALVVTTVTAVDLNASGFAPSSRCFLGGTEAVYASPSSVYLATSRWPQPTRDAADRWVYPSDAQLRTDIHKFSIDASTIAYRATGQVVGHLGWDPERMPYRMSEHEGLLRVLSFTGAQGWFGTADSGNAAAPAPSPAILTILRDNTADQTLLPVSTLPNTTRAAPIGKPGEQVYGVRFAGNRAYVVTFRQIDPLYVLDLSNPADPKQAGALEVTGFSDNLYPLANGLLLGVGREADAQGRVTAVKVALFDVASPSTPTQIDARSFGGLGSTTALDFSSQGISFLNDGARVRVALPMALTTGIGSYERSMQRLEVDTVARSLRLLSPLAAPSSAGSGAFFGGDLTFDRGVHIGSNLYFYAAGVYASGVW